MKSENIENSEYILCTGLFDNYEENLNYYKDLLEKNKITVTVRRSRGKDIDAACGQLANKEVNLN